MTKRSRDRGHHQKRGVSGFLEFHPDVSDPVVDCAGELVDKSFTIMEGKKLQLRFSGFNLLNHPRFGTPDTNSNDAGFGTVNPSQNNQARTVEIGA